MRQILDEKTNTTFCVNPQTKTVFPLQADCMPDLENITNDGGSGCFDQLENLMCGSDSEPSIYTYYTDQGSDLMLAASTKLHGEDPITLYLQSESM